MVRSTPVPHSLPFAFLALLLAFSSLFLIDPANAGVSLGAGAASSGEETATTFSGGVSINGSAPVNNATAMDSDGLFVSASIFVDPSDVGETADIFQVVAFTPAAGGFSFFNKTGDGVWSAWDFGAESLAASQPDATLGSSVELRIYEGFLPIGGTFDFYVGYRLGDGTIIFNPTSINFTIEVETPLVIDMSVRVSLTAVENQLLARINQERNAAGLPTLVRDPGLDWIIYWHGTNMATGHFLSHVDPNNRRAEARARYYSGDVGVRCSEIIQWWGGAPSGDVHYDGYFNSPSHHMAYMEEGIFNLGPTMHVGVVALDGTGPAGSAFDGRAGSYTAVFFCDRPLTLEIDPFAEE